MAGRDESSAMLWSWIAWAAALAGAVLIGIIVAGVIGAGRAAGLIFGGVSFVVLGYVLTFTLPRPERKTEAHVATGHAASPAPAPHAPAAPPAPAAPVMSAPGATAPEPVAPPSGISERVREAARAAGEAARAATSAAVTPEPMAPQRPTGLGEPRPGGADDLKRIKGVGPKLEEVLHRLGYFHFDQIAAWSPDELAWVDSHLEGFNGRATREDWVGQARILAAGGETEHSRAVDRGEIG